jgi:WD40 repeat protein
MTTTLLPPVPFARPVVFGDPNFHADGDLAALSFADDGTLWSVEEAGMLRHWEVPSGRQLGCAFLSDLETLWCFSPDARLLASASDDLSLWDVASGQLLSLIPQPSWVTALAFAPDGSLLATGHDDGVVRCWDVRGRRLAADFRLHQRAVSALAFRPDGTHLASAGEDKAIAVWALAARRLAATLTGHTDRIPALTWHSNGRRLVSAGWDTTARVWDTDTGQPIILLNSHAGQVSSLAFSPGGDLLACADSADSVHVWRFEDHQKLRQLQGGRDIRCLAFNLAGDLLAGAGGERVVHLWNTENGQLLSPRAGDSSSRTVVALSPDGTRLVNTGWRLGVRQWGTCRAEPAEPGCLVASNLGAASRVHCAVYSPDGHWVAAGAADGLIHIRDAITGEDPWTLEGQQGPVTALAFSADSRLLASASAAQTEVWLWDTRLREPRLLIPDALDGCTVEALAFHPGNRLLVVGGIDWLATGGSDGAACLWDIEDRCEVAMLTGGTTCLALDPSGRWLATASLVRSIRIWDLESHEQVAELHGHEDTINALAISPDGRWLASGGDDRLLRLWKVTSGKWPSESRVKVLLDTQIKSLCFAPDSRSLYTGNGNTTSYRLEVRQLLEQSL